MVRCGEGLGWSRSCSCSGLITVRIVLFCCECTCDGSRCGGMGREYERRKKRVRERNGINSVVIKDEEYNRGAAGLNKPTSISWYR